MILALVIDHTDIPSLPIVSSVAYPLVEYFMLRPSGYPTKNSMMAEMAALAAQM